MSTFILFLCLQRNCRLGMIERNLPLTGAPILVSQPPECFQRKMFQAGAMSKMLEDVEVGKFEIL